MIVLRATSITRSPIRRGSSPPGTRVIRARRKWARTRARNSAEPNGFVTEYTTEVEQVGVNYVGDDSDWWTAQKVFPCRWNMAGVTSPFARKAMGGELVVEENQRCEQVMAKALGR